MESGYIHCMVINSALILLSLCAIWWAIYHSIKTKRRRWLPCLIGFLSLTVIALCIPALCRNLYHYDMWKKIIRTPQELYIQDIALTKDECLDDFKEIIKIVETNYQEVARHKNINLKKLHANYLSEIVRVKDAEGYASLLLKYFSALQNMHTFPYLLKYKSHISLVTRNDSIWIFQCPKNVNLKRKDLILSIDGIPTADVIRQNTSKVFASTDAARKKYAALNVLNSYTDTCKTVTIQRNDSIFNVIIPLHKELCYSLRNKEKKITPDKTKKSNQALPALTDRFKKELNIGYISISTFNSNSAEHFTRLLDSLQGCPHLILNLEDNLGGKKGNVIEIAKKLIDTEKKMGNQIIKSEPTHYKGKIYILMNELSSSGAEYLIGLLKGQRNVTVIGQRSGGDCDSNGYNFKTSYGIEFKLATEPAFLLPDGITYSEGEGIMPDIEIQELLPWEKGESSFLKALKLVCVERNLADLVQGLSKVRQ